ncbi:MAG: dockerin type I repeat-containing protein [Clostridia bacterium]|nr:dockerin type I repeat-containing protein [Clostridia bacterium]
MKKIFALTVALCCFAVFAVAAEDVRYAFGVSEVSAISADEAYVTVSCVENRGIASGALNFTYDKNAVRFVRCELCESTPVDCYSVYDNEFGQVRVAFVSTSGVFTYTGDMFRLYFAPLCEDSYSEITIKTGYSELFDDDYSLTVFSASDGSVSFAVSGLGVAEGSGLVIDNAGFLIKGVIPGTDVDTLGSMLTGDFFLPDDVHTGASVRCGDLFYTIVIKGDTDKNGEVDLNDYVTARMYFICGAPDAARLAACDTDGDGELTEADHALLLAHVLGETDIFDPEDQ